MYNINNNNGRAIMIYNSLGFSPQEQGMGNNSSNNDINGLGCKNHPE